MPRRDPTEQSCTEELSVWRRPLHSLPTRIGFFVLGATLCTSLIVAGIALRSIDSFLRKQIENSFPAILERTASELDAWYDDRAADARNFAGSTILEEQLDELVGDSNTAANSPASEQIRRELERLLARTPEIDSAFLLSREAELLLWVGQQIELSTSMREEIQRAQLSRAGYSRGRYFQIASVELEGDHGTTLHLVMGLEQLATVLRVHGGGSSGRISIVDADRRYLASSASRLASAKYALPLPTAGGPIEAVDSTGPDGERSISSAMALGRSGWSLVIEDAYDIAFGRVVAATRQVLGINLAIVAIFALIAYRVAVGMIRPIEALCEAAQRIARGERSFEIPRSTSRDEVGLLTRAFFEMKCRIDANAREIEAAHRSVEDVNDELRCRNDELHQANEVLAQLSITDGLTQLHNHRFFQDHLVREAKRADRTKEPLALILIDIDHFKTWNDRLGHAGGDEILRRIAEVMSTLLRTTDLLARYGGEEFALVAPGTNPQGALQLAEKMRSTISQTRFLIDPPSEHQRLTVSIGVSSYAGNRKRLFSEADQALYRAKASGRDCVMAFDAHED